MGAPRHFICAGRTGAGFTDLCEVPISSLFLARCGLDIFHNTRDTRRRYGSNVAASLHIMLETRRLLLYRINEMAQYRYLRRA